MNLILKKFLKSLNTFVKSDLTCLIKFNQNSFELIDFYSAKNITLDFENIINKAEKLDFTDIQNLLLSEYNLSSYLVNNFILGSNQYFLFSGSEMNNQYCEDEEKIHLENSETIKAIISFQDVKDNKLSVEENYFNLFAKYSGEFIFTLDQSGVFTFVNDYGINQLKYSIDDLLGRHFFEIISDDYKSTAGDVFQKIILENIETSFDVEIIPKVGIEEKYRIKLIPYNGNNDLIQLLGIGTNIHIQNIEKKRNEELSAKLKEANRLNAIERDRAKQQISILSELNNLKNEFISNVSHELRTPLASIIGFSETILDDNNLTVEKSREFNNVILTESKRLGKLINDVLDFSELESEKQQLEKESVDIIDILNSCIENFSEECKNKKLTLTSNIPESKITIYADSSRLIKAFSYLLSNAIKFTRDNGRITLIAQEFLKEVEIVISDTGIGIPEQKIPLLFDKFSKVKRVGNNLPGAGFGLVTVKQIIDLHKGLIRVKSEVDKGTSFIIRLPKYSFN